MPGNYAYVADYTGGVQVVDISSPESAIIIHDIPTQDKAYSIAISGQWAYVADSISNLQVINLLPE